MDLEVVKLFESDSTLRVLRGRHQFNQFYVLFKYNKPRNQKEEPEWASLYSVLRVFTEKNRRRAFDFWRRPPREIENLHLVFFIDDYKESADGKLVSKLKKIVNIDAGSAIVIANGDEDLSRALENFIRIPIALQDSRNSDPHRIILSDAENVPVFSMRRAPNEEVREEIHLGLQQSKKQKGYIEVAQNSDGTALALSSGSMMQLVRKRSGQGKADVVAEVRGEVSIPFSGDFRGRVRGRCALRTNGLKLGFCFGISGNASQDPPADTSAMVHYPLLHEQHDTQPLIMDFQFRLLPSSAKLKEWSTVTKTHKVHAPFLFPKGTAAIRSGYQTIVGHSIWLLPADGKENGFFFGIAPAGELYLMPYGDFILAAETKLDITQRDLMCGLWATERVDFDIVSLEHKEAGDQQKTTVFRYIVNSLVATEITTRNAVQGTASNQLLLSVADSKNFMVPMLVVENQRKTAVVTTDLYYRTETEEDPFFGHVKMLPVNAGDAQQQTVGSGVTLSRGGNVGKQGQLFNGAFPLLPYQNVKADSGSEVAALMVEMERQLMQPARRSLAWEGHQPLFRSTSPAWFTPAGVRFDFPPSFSESDNKPPSLTLCRLNEGDVKIEIGFAPRSEDRDLEAMANVRDVFNAPQPFIVSSPEFFLFSYGLQTFKGVVNIGGWRFDLAKSSGAGKDRFENIIIFKRAWGSTTSWVAQPERWTNYQATFGRSSGGPKTDPSGQGLSRWIQDYFDRARRLCQQGDTGMAAFCDVIDDPSWTGVLALAVGLTPDTLPGPAGALVGGLDDLHAHHIGCGWSRLSLTGTSTLDIQSSAFGLVNYQSPLLDPVTASVPQLVDRDQDFSFEVLRLSLQFAENRVIDSSLICMLVANRWFGDAVPRRGSSPGGTNRLVFAGALPVENNGAPMILDPLPGPDPLFFTESNAIASIRLTAAQMRVVSTEAEAGTGSAVFAIEGVLRFRSDPRFDLLSYEHLVFRGVTISVALNRSGDHTIRFNDDDVTLVSDETQLFDTYASVGMELPTRSPTDSLVRAGSLAAQFPLGVPRLVTIRQQDRPAAADGFEPLEIEQPDDIAFSPPDQGPWYGLQFSLTLGGQGSFGANGVLSADLLLAWKPGGDGTRVAAAPLFRLLGPGGAPLNFEIQGVIDVGAEAVVLNRLPTSGAEDDTGRFVLVFESIGLRLLSLSFPAQGTTNLMVLGDTAAVPEKPVEPVLAWFGGYIDKGFAEKVSG